MRNRAASPLTERHQSSVTRTEAPYQRDDAGGAAALRALEEFLFQQEEEEEEELG